MVDEALERDSVRAMPHLERDKQSRQSHCRPIQTDFLRPLTPATARTSVLLFNFEFATVIGDQDI